MSTDGSAVAWTQYNDTTGYHVTWRCDIATANRIETFQTVQLPPLDTENPAAQGRFFTPDKYLVGISLFSLRYVVILWMPDAYLAVTTKPSTALAATKAVYI